MTHLSIMSQSHKSPSCDALRQGETYGHITLIVGLQGWIEESRLVQVLACLHLVEHFFSLCRLRHRAAHSDFSVNHILCRALGKSKQLFGVSISGSSDVHHSTFLLHQFIAFDDGGCCLCTLHRSVFHGTFGKEEHLLAIKLALEVERIKTVGLQFVLLIILSREVAAKARIAGSHGEVVLPIATGQRLIEAQVHLPCKPLQRVERLVVEHTHQLRLGWFSVGRSDAQCPFLLLSWCKSVAESFPLDVQLLLGHGTCDVHGA